MEVYENPLITRYAGSEMAENFSENKRIRLFRKLWIALAEGEKKLGLNISESQIDDLKKYEDKLNPEVARVKEKELRHDIMAQIHAYGEQAKLAAPIIHLGATSNYVNDNADLIIYRDALNIIKKKLINVIDRLAVFADKYKNTPTLGYTHFQPAQLTTVGKRATLWIQDLMIDFECLNALIDGIKLRGCKGTTGTQASFLELFNGDSGKVKQLDKFVVEYMGFSSSYSVTGQTYPRKFDYQLLSLLSQIAQSAYKFSNDLRLLQSNKEIEEPFEKSQIGSSAMPYKRNPMRSERISSLSRLVISYPVNAAITASTQWFERTLDDSANKRIVIPEAFLALDGILNLYLNISENMVVYEKMIEKHINAELPFMATEIILMECVKSGGNRQELHEKIRQHSMESARRVKTEGAENDLIFRIKSDGAFACVIDRLDSIMNPANFTGRAAEQTQEYLSEEIYPLLNLNRHLLGEKVNIEV